MSPEITTEVINPTTDILDWQPPMPPTDLIFDDGEPLETNRHRVAMNLLIRSLKHHWAERTNFFTGGNMFVYYSSKQARNQDFRGPDFFVVLDVDSNPTRLGWVVWEEEGRYPDVIVELLSDSTKAVDLGAKKHLYEQVFKTKDYFVFHPLQPNSLQGWHLNTDIGYQILSPNPQGWLWCQTLGLWLGTWQGKVEDDPAIWLRFYDEAGNVVLLPEEGERQRADAEQQRADAEQQRADAERQRADAERQRAERLAQRLRDLGEDPDQL
ncbi:Uma2 family endonuclease [Nostoc sp. JL33]|uniref:Uma2 family endonuclease n=1 Tax=Nostoc sp. JL33 TaxID=2815396 RepID=UPI0025E85876|nr:Uma2 family endonuclease [Nostoc sp. JL33]MBN3873638.1 Uma2 family endonuclease [Nostoc sp. JL33]